MGAKVTFKITTKDKLGNVPITDGQLIFVQDAAKIYLDYGGDRVCYTPEVQTGINYVGISTTDPSSGTVTISDKPDYSPKEKDIVVYGKKEYMWRKGENKQFGWFEIGDEDSPEWH